ncbi:hypothetical protein SAMN04488035_2229, partial [Flavimobilis marinus]
EYYGARVRLGTDGSVQLHVTRGSGTPMAGGVVQGVTFGAGDELRLRLQVEGTSPTVVRAKVWPEGSAEPEAWRAVGSDSTAALQAAGGLGIQSYTGGPSGSPSVVFSYDDLQAGSIG